MEREMPWKESFRKDICGPLKSNFDLPFGTVEQPLTIDQYQLDNAKIYSNRNTFIPTIPKNARYIEVGVGGGDYSLLFNSINQPVSLDLIDPFNHHEFGTAKLSRYTQDTHYEFVEKQFAGVPNVILHKGTSQDILPTLPKASFDYIYLDGLHSREKVRQDLWNAKELIAEGGIIGVNDYIIWDFMVEDIPYGVVQTVAEFLDVNKDWHVHAFAFQEFGFCDIYLKKS